MNRLHEKPPPIPLQVWMIGAVTGIAAFMAMLDSTLANLALESIRVDLKSDLLSTQWVVSAYLIALAVSLPTTGWLASRYGSGRVWLAATCMFVVASAFCALATDATSLVAARILQGLAGGVMTPAGQAVIGTTTNARQLGRLMGVLGLVVSLGPAIGPPIGGWLLEVASWRWLFWINVPIGVIAVILGRRIVPTGEITLQRSLDLTGLVLLGIGLPAVLFGAAEIGLKEINLARVLLVTLGVAACLTVAVRSYSINSPLLDLRLFRKRTFAAATFTTGFTGANLYGGLLLLPLYLQLQAGFSVVEAGGMLLVMGLGTAIALPLGGWGTDYYGAGLVSFIGIMLLIVSSLPFVAPMTVTTPLLLGLLVLRGIGIAWAQMPAMTAAYASLEKAQMGDASALINIVQRIGGAVGAIGIAALLTGGVHSPDPTDFLLGFTALTVLSAMTLTPQFLMWRSLMPTN